MTEGFSLGLNRIDSIDQLNPSSTCILSTVGEIVYNAERCGGVQQLAIALVRADLHGVAAIQEGADAKHVFSAECGDGRQAGVASGEKTRI